MTQIDEYELTDSQLHGFDKDKAECYGKPHILARYTGDDIRRYEHDDGLCPLCHQRIISNVHHQPGGRHPFVMYTKRGRFVLKPALFALCGSGITGCHGLIHRHEIKVKWVWDIPEFKRDWWEGITLSHGYKMHDERLYGQGCWRFEMDGRVWEYRGSKW